MQLLQTSTTQDSCNFFRPEQLKTLAAFPDLNHSRFVQPLQTWTTQDSCNLSWLDPFQTSVIYSKHRNHRKTQTIRISEALKSVPVQHY
jgi:hypothetical protein